MKHNREHIKHDYIYNVASKKLQRIQTLVPVENREEDITGMGLKLKNPPELKPNLQEFMEECCSTIKDYVDNQIDINRFEYYIYFDIREGHEEFTIHISSIDNPNVYIVYIVPRKDISDILILRETNDYINPAREKQIINHKLHELWHPFATVIKAFGLGSPREQALMNDLLSILLKKGVGNVSEQPLSME